MMQNKTNLLLQWLQILDFPFHCDFLLCLLVYSTAATIFWMIQNILIKDKKLKLLNVCHQHAKSLLKNSLYLQQIHNNYARNIVWTCLFCIGLHFLVEIPSSNNNTVKHTRQSAIRHKSSLKTAILTNSTGKVKKV